MKSDFKQAFFNLNSNESSSFITTFIYDNNYHKFNVMPFGLANAPFAVPICLNQITKFIRTHTKWVWGDIDDVIVAHTDPEVLNNLIKVLLQKLVQNGK